MTYGSPVGARKKIAIKFSKTEGITPQSIKTVPDQSGVMRKRFLANTESS